MQAKLILLHPSLAKRDSGKFGKIQRFIPLVGFCKSQGTVGLGTEFPNLARAIGRMYIQYR